MNQIYYVIRCDTNRVMGRVHGGDEDAALSAARDRHLRVAREVGIRVELASAPPTRLAEQLSRMNTAQHRQHSARLSKAAHQINRAR